MSGFEAAAALIEKREFEDGLGLPLIEPTPGRWYVDSNRGSHVGSVRSYVRTDTEHERPVLSVRVRRNDPSSLAEADNNALVAAMAPDLYAIVREIALTPTTSEKPGGTLDDAYVDDLICRARKAISSHPTRPSTAPVEEDKP